MEQRQFTGWQGVCPGCDRQLVILDQSLSELMPGLNALEAVPDGPIVIALDGPVGSAPIYCPRCGALIPTVTTN